FSLLMKFYQDYDGEISIGNRNLSELSEEQIRNMIAYIPQDNTLFHGSIKDNLLYGKNQSVSEERINEVLKELGLTKLVNDLENGLDTEISDSGTGLSEGQKQRFNIARALLLEHPIYLLDEVTASLDSITERIISKAIDKLTAGKTRLTIAHRLHTVKEADSILVLDKGGQVVDFGTHNQLIGRNKLYNEFLVGLQQAS
ncbi:ATP-binding cassette domain-containing protein, partial [Streptococcus pluranimalium]|uniref:ATP-binding cassette domain-containing protein n=2 Tax=Streptococcus TaxID=1301 RepID=UPI003F66938C